MRARQDEAVGRGVRVKLEGKAMGVVVSDVSWTLCHGHCSLFCSVLYCSVSNQSMHALGSTANNVDLW